METEIEAEANSELKLTLMMWIASTGLAVQSSLDALDPETTDTAVALAVYADALGAYREIERELTRAVRHVRNLRDVDPRQIRRDVRQLRTSVQAIRDVLTTLETGCESWTAAEVS